MNRHPYILNILLAACLMVLEKKTFKVFFPIISLWELYVAMANKVPIQSAQKPYAAFPPT